MHCGSTLIIFIFPRIRILSFLSAIATYHNLDPPSATTHLSFRIFTDIAMPPKKKGSSSKKPAATASAPDEAALAESARLRLAKAAQGPLIRDAAPPMLDCCALPRALRKSDGADIVKKNSRRAPKYLLLFPGHFEVTPGQKVGKLQSLDSRTPTLDVSLKTGTLRFRGALIFPKNTFLTVKASNSAGSNTGKLNIEDVFETLLVFAEWSYIGDLDTNPGMIPKEFPVELRRQVETDPAFKAARLQPVHRRVETAIISGKDSRADATAQIIDSDDEDDVDNSEDLMRRLRDDDEDNSDDEDEFSTPKNFKVGRTAKRKNPVRSERKSVDYSKMFSNEEEDEDNGDESSEEKEDEDAVEEVPVSTKRRKRAPIIDLDEETPARTKAKKGVTKSTSMKNVDSDGDEVLEEDEKRRSTRKKKTCTIISSDEEDNDDDDDIVEEVKPKKRAPKKKKQSVILDSDSHSDEDMGKTSTTTTAAAAAINNKKTAGGKKRRRSVVTVKDEDEEEDDDDEDFAFPADLNGNGASNGHIGTRRRSGRKTTPRLAKMKDESSEEESVESDDLFT